MKTRQDIQNKLECARDKAQLKASVGNTRTAGYRDVLVEIRTLEWVLGQQPAQAELREASPWE